MSTILDKFTGEELDYFKTVMENYKLPWISRMWKKYVVPRITYFIFPTFILLTILFLIYNAAKSDIAWIWFTCKAIVFTCFGFGGFVLIAHFSETISTYKLRKRLGLTKAEFDVLVNLWQITGMN